MNKLQSETPVIYRLSPDPKAAEDQVIRHALKILEKRVKSGPLIDSPQTLRDFLKLRLAGLDYEMFSVLLLNSQHQFVHYEEMFRGTLTQASVYPREVVKLALAHSAAAAILCHNHPSALCAPSEADINLTQTLKAALALIDVKVLDHIIVGGSESTSMALSGLV